MTKNENLKTNDSKSYDKFSNKKPFNNVPPADDECLAPILITAELRSERSIIKDNIETWNIRGFKIPVAFAPVKKEYFSEWMHFFWGQVRAYAMSGGKTDLASELGHEDDYSYDKFMDDKEDADAHGFVPVSAPSEEEALLVKELLNNLIKDANEISPKYAQIIELLWKDNTKQEIIKKLGLGKKSQGYSQIKAAQKLAKELFEKY